MSRGGISADIIRAARRYVGGGDLDALASVGVQAVMAGISVRASLATNSYRISCKYMPARGYGLRPLAHHGW